MNRFILVLIAVMLAAPMLAAPAMAEGLSYNYLQAGYQRVELDDDFLDVDGDGFGIGGSFEIGRNAYVFANYGTADFDFGVDFNELGAGIGYHMSVGTQTDFVASIGYIRGEAEAPGSPSVDDSGIAASIGLRSMVTDKLELFGSINYADLDDSGDETSVGAGMWYSVTDAFALGVSAGVGDDTNSYGLGARLYFGN